MPRLIFFTLMLVLMTSCGTTARMIEIGSDEDLTTISSIHQRHAGIRRFETCGRQKKCRDDQPHPQLYASAS